MRGRPPESAILYPLGILAIVGAMFASSLTGLILRYIESPDDWQIIFYRSIGFFAIFFLYVTIRRRGALTDPVSRLSGAGWSAAACMAGTFVFFVLAFQHTTVATVVILFSVSPIVVAVLARVWLGETIRGRTLIAICVVIPGVALVVGVDLTGGSATGALLALLAAVGYSGSVVALRHHAGGDSDIILCAAGLFTVVIAGVMIGSLSLGGRDAALSLLLGIGPLAAQYILISVGARWVPAAEISLLTFIEILLAPVWVWLFFDEVPSDYTVVGGVLIIGAVLAHTFLGAKEVREIAQPPVITRGSSLSR